MNAVRLNPKLVAGGLVFTLTLYIIGGWTGVLTSAAVLVLLYLRVRPRELIIMGGVLFLLVPLSMLQQGLIVAEQLSLNVAAQYVAANAFAFAGFVYLVVGVVLDVLERSDDDDDRHPHASSVQRRR